MSRVVKGLGRRDPEARRQRVLAVAVRRFATTGYEATSVNEVAAEAGVAIGTLYKYFPDKAALLEGVLEQFEHEFAAWMQQASTEGGPFAARVHRMIDGLFTLASEREHFFWALSAGTHSLRGQRAHTPGDTMRAIIADFLRAGIAAGEFRSLDVDKMAALGFGVVEAAMQRCFGGESGQHRAAWVALVSEVLTRAVAPAREA